MSRERYVLLGLARARAGWFRTVSQWSATAAAPVEFVRCVSADEVRARLGSGRPFSAVLVAADAPGLDRDLVAEAADAGCSVLVVDDPGHDRDWRAVGVAAVLSPPFSRDELLEVLGVHARPVGSAVVDAGPSPTEPATAEGTLVAVTGPGGTGASTAAIALAQGLAQGLHRPSGNGWPGWPSRLRPPGRRGGSRGEAPAAPRVLLADLCRAADQAMLHDSRAVVPGLQELVEAHRTATPARSTVRDQTFEVSGRGYRLLLGLRRPRQWTALRPRAVEAALASLRQVADVVIADVEADLEGEEETGSADVEDRNLPARLAVGGADAVLVVGEPSMKGLHALVRTLTELLAFGVEVERLVVALNRSPRKPRLRAELARAVAELLAASTGDRARQLAAPVHLPERRVDEALRDGVELPAPLPATVAGAVVAALDRAGRRTVEGVVPEPVVPGSLSGFSAQEPPDDA